MAKECINNEFLSLRGYERLAIKLLKKHGPKLKYLTKSQDNIDYIINALIKSDIRFDGRGSRTGYRYQNGRYATMNVLRRIQQNQQLSLDADIGNNATFKNFVAVKQLSMDDRILFNDIMDYIHRSTFFTECEKDVLKLRFKENMKMIDIANDLNLSIQRIHDIINEAIDKLRWKFNDR